jgi:hypothetical protein
MTNKTKRRLRRYAGAIIYIPFGIITVAVASVTIGGLWIAGFWGPFADEL